VRRLAATIVVALLCKAMPAGADTPPSVWDIARDASERDRWGLHVRVQRLLPPGEGTREDELRLQAARAILEDAGAAESPDVRLRFDLGIVYGRLDMSRRAVDVLAPALQAAGDLPAATEAFAALAYAYAKLNQPADELATWRRYIPRLEDDRSRAPEMMNMGEAEMRLGLVDDAIGTFREGLRLCAELPNTQSVISTQVLTLWDLAVALDRSGDPRGAVETAGKAKAMRWQKIAFTGSGPPVRIVTGWDEIHETAGVFFVPEWERDWYLALGAVAGAVAASDARDETAYWSAAARHWERYVAGSSTASVRDPWLTIARLRLDHARAQRAAAARRAAGLPRRPDAPKAWDLD
jgi:tetratricopeptide (TPR) repeat protein